MFKFCQVHKIGGEMTDNYPLISIIVPCYNVIQYLPDTLDSLLNQTYENIEIILVDDGSVDGTSDLCDSYLKKDDRVIVLHKKNGGIVSARNSGFELVKGEWHMYLDGDDWIDLDTCENLVKAIYQNSNIDVFFWNSVQMLDGKIVEGKIGWIVDCDQRIYKEQECVELARNTLIYKSGIATACSKLINTNFAIKNKIIHDNSLRQGCEGIEFSLRCFYNAASSCFLNKNYTKYRYVPNSISKSISERNVEYITDCLNVIEKFIGALPEKQSFYPAFCQRVCYAIIAFAMSTYFHPQNKEKYLFRKNKFKKVLRSNPLYKEAISKVDLGGLDKMRGLVIRMIRVRFFLGIEIMSNVKQFMLKRGKFNY